MYSHMNEVEMVWMKEQKMWRTINKKTNVGMTYRVLWAPKIGPPHQTQGTTKDSFHTSHFSICTWELHSIFIMGPLTYVSYDFKKNSAYQQGIIAPPLKLMGNVDSSLLVGPGGIVLPSPSSLSALHLEGEWLVICLALVLSWMGPSVSEGSCGAPCWKKRITLKRGKPYFLSYKVQLPN